MRFKKAILLTLIFTVSAYVLAILLFGYPLVLDFSTDADQVAPIYHKGDTIKPFSNFNLDDGEWTSYIFISKDDSKTLSKEIPPYNRLVTTDKLLLQQMKNEWVFVYTESDIATATSSIVLCRNGIKIFESGIVLDESSQGLQSSQFGWLTNSNAIQKSCSQFKRVYSPIIILK